MLARQACAIADAADSCASGVVELTNRANLQVRGVKPEAEATLTQQLSDAGLGPRVRASESLDHPSQAQQQALLAADDARNLLLSPAAGLDAAALYDTTPLADQILAALQDDARLVELSPKFSVLLDGGEQLAVLDHPHDVWFAAMPSATSSAVDKPRFAIGLAGQPAAHGCNALAAVSVEDVVPLLRALLHLFLDVAAPDENRMRDLLRSHDPDAILAQAAYRAGMSLQRDAAVGAWRRAVAEPARRFGAHPQRQTGLWYVGAQPPLGRLDTAALRALARLASIHGDGTLRCTPWQSVLLPHVAQREVPQVEHELRSLGFVLHADDPLARLIACAGSAGCAKGLADTKADALYLAARLPSGVEVHLSGCTRSCAAAHCAPYTLLAVERGRYDLYRRRHDPTHDRDASQALDGALRFGERIAIDLNIEEAAKQLGEAARSDHP